MQSPPLPEPDLSGPLPGLSGSDHIGKGLGDIGSLSLPTAAIIWHTPASGGFDEDQPAWRNFTGQSFDELRGWGWIGAIHPEDRAHTEKAWSSALASQSVYSIEHRLRDLNGNYHDMAVHGVPILNSDGTIRQWIGIHTDISERKATEEFLRLLVSAVEQSKESIVITNAVIELPGPEIIFVNSAFTTMTGYSREEALGNTPRMLQGLLTDRKVLDRLKTCLKKGEVFEGETINYRKNGESFNIEWQVAPIRNSLKKVTHYVAIQRDISERKSAEIALAQSQEKLLGILNSIPQRVFWKDLHHVFLGCNQSFASDTGLKDPGDIVGKTDFDVNSRALAELYQADDRDVIEKDKPKYAIEEPGRDAHGGQRWFRTSKVPLHDQKGSVIGVLGTYEDVTQFKLAKMEIQRLEDQLILAQKMEMVGKLAGGIAHEFNSILTAILGQSDLLIRALPAGSPLDHNVREISNAATRAAVLTAQLLAYGRKQVLKPQVLDLNQILLGMEGMFQHLLGKNVDVLVVPFPDLHKVLADAGQISQVIMNMVANAGDAMPFEGKLTLETANISFRDQSIGSYPELKQGDYVVLAITDTGSGMASDVMTRVFEPFYSTKEVGAGTGLGLSICYGIVKQSGGHITVYSEPRQGTTFKVYLPRNKEEESAVKGPGEAGVLPGGSETILLVDDDPSLREMEATLLRRLGYTVRVAKNGLEAIQWIQAHRDEPIDLMLTDVSMPHINGGELYERIQKSHPNLKVLFTSARTEGAILHQNLLDVQSAFLHKPFSPSALAEKLRKVLDQQESKLG